MILAKARLIYTTGSGFVDVARYFNLQMKIVSLDQRRMSQGKNNVPMPRMDLYDSLCSEPLRWNYLRLVGKACCGGVLLN